MSLILLVQAEISESHEKYGHFASAHEGLGVLIEEVDELRAAIHENDPGAIILESVQVAATAMRLGQCLSSDSVRKRTTGDGPTRATVESVQGELFK